MTPREIILVQDAPVGSVVEIIGSTGPTANYYRISPGNPSADGRQPARKRFTGDLIFLARHNRCRIVTDVEGF